jgi:hypothetical protein
MALAARVEAVKEGTKETLQRLLETLVVSPSPPH